MVDGQPVFPEMPIGEALANLDILGIEALIVLGGEGTLAIAEQFHKRGFPVIGVPKTIDNDLAATELTFGFMTAIDIATEALDRLHTTAASHDRVMILEVMGRNTGWIALHAGPRRQCGHHPDPRDTVLVRFDRPKRCRRARRAARGSRTSLSPRARGRSAKREMYQDTRGDAARRHRRIRSST